MIGAMTSGVDQLDSHVADDQRTTSQPCARRQRHEARRPGRLGQPLPSGDVIGVHVRVEDVHNPDAVPFGELEVGLDPPRRIHDHRAGGACDEVRGAAEVVVEDLAEEHRIRGV